MTADSDQKTSKNRFFLQTARLAFRAWAQSDLELALGLWGDPRVTRYFDAREKFSAQEVQDRLAREISGQINDGVQYWPIFLRSSHEHVGCCGLRPYQPADKIYEIGFHIRARHWGNGYATEAARGVMAYAFRELGIHGLFAGHNPENSASRYLLQKLGFRYTHDEYYAPTGLQHPSYILTADEYQPGSAKNQVKRAKDGYDTEGP
jgi:RimJ/RimL family protein N-acetyltransferase